MALYSNNRSICADLNIDISVCETFEVPKTQLFQGLFVFSYLFYFLKTSCLWLCCIWSRSRPKVYRSCFINLSKKQQHLKTISTTFLTQYYTQTLSASLCITCRDQYHWQGSCSVNFIALPFYLIFFSNPFFVQDGVKW